MSFSFDPRKGIIIVTAVLNGPVAGRRGILRLALDTGASHTLISTDMLVTAGYDPAMATERTQITTGSGVEYAPRIAISKLKALGRERSKFKVLGHTLPPSARIDGLLGLDFLRGLRLVVDFRKGSITLN